MYGVKIMHYNIFFLLSNSIEIYGTIDYRNEAAFCCCVILVIRASSHQQLDLMVLRVLFKRMLHVVAVDENIL